MTTDWAQDTFNQWLECHLALGIVASYSARMEARVREAYCTDQARHPVLAALTDCGQAREARNDMIHSVS